MNAALPRPRDEGDAGAQADTPAEIPAGTASTLDATGSVTPDPFLAEVARIPERASVPAADPLLRPGEEIGHFVVLSELGRGGMGVVYAAQDRSLGRTVALKVLPAADDEERRRRFMREARAAAAVSHPGIATIFEVGEVSGRVFIAMELVRGATLRARLDSGALPVREALRIARAIARALEQAHARGVVHRDLKPENVMIADDGHVKLLDFGLAKPINATDSGLGTATTATEQGRILGTPSYMSPEQAKGRPVDARSDVFSFGVMFYELLTGRRPFSGGTVVEIFIALDRDEPKPPSRENPKVTAEIERVVLRCLRKDPAARYLDAGALVRDLEPAVAPISTPPPPLRRTRPWMRVLVAALALVGSLVVAFAMHGRHTRSATAPTAVTDRPAPRESKPEAIRLYREGLAALREGRDYEGLLVRALEIDPDLAEAHVELAAMSSSHMSDFAREHYRKANALRDRLTERDRALLDAIEPLVQRQPADWAESNRRLQAALDRFPGDAELWHFLGWGRANYDDFEAAVRFEKKAIELDPRYACGYHTLGIELAYLGREDEAFRVVDQCLAAVPGAIDCMGTAAKIHAMRGECSAMEGVARRMIAAGAPGGNAYGTLAEALAAQRRPIATVREALRQGEQSLADLPPPRLSETSRKQKKIGDQARLALLEGNFEAVETLAGEFAPTVETSRSQSEHGRLARNLAQLYTEMGRDQDAARTALDFLERREAWEPAPSAEDAAMADDATPSLLVVAMHGGAITRDDFVGRRESWRRGWTARMTPVTKNFLWLHGYAAMAESAEDANEAIEALPRFLPLPPFHPESLVDARVGRMYLQAGRVDEAITWLEPAVKSCYVTHYPFLSVQARLWLGQAREAKGDKKGACAAYADVISRWGRAKPRSVTADAARARMDALRCGG